jgi:hypothetical protein
MRYFDVFHGDADGFCALRQLRLAHPVDAQLVTGLKRDVALLERVPAMAGDEVTVLDVSLERNRAALIGLLARGVTVHYFDHHFAGNIPEHVALETVIDDHGRHCTSSLVDHYLAGRFRPWAIVGAFGDNLPELATALALSLDLGAEHLEALRELGEALNYNAYGNVESDVMIPPADLYRIVSGYDHPLALFRAEPIVGKLARERQSDLERGFAVPPVQDTPGTDAHLLPNEHWSRRVVGALANLLALDDPHRAHAVIVPLPEEGYVASVRAPQKHGPTAVEFCSRFPTGGGRVHAAGVDFLPPEALGEFLNSFARAWAR